MSDLARAVDAMLAAYANYINNSACADGDEYWKKFVQATETCQELRKKNDRD